MRSTVDLVCIDPKRVSEVWPHVKHLIRSAIERTGLSDFLDVERSVLRGDQLLWMAWNGLGVEAAATTHLIRVSGRKVCELTACGGKDRMRWLPLLNDIETYAKNEGCDAMRILGREGWSRVLNDYHIAHVVLEKDLG